MATAHLLGLDHHVELSGVLTLAYGSHSHTAEAAGSEARHQQSPTHACSRQPSLVLSSGDRVDLQLPPNAGGVLWQLVGEQVVVWGWAHVLNAAEACTASVRAANRSNGSTQGHIVCGPTVQFRAPTLLLEQAVLQPAWSTPPSAPWTSDDHRQRRGNMFLRDSAAAFSHRENRPAFFLT